MRIPHVNFRSEWKYKLTTVFLPVLIILFCLHHHGKLYANFLATPYPLYLKEKTV